jgi:predicted 2-oxoglutarate/Fe(II)-dependent dioxygenase YbiX
LLKYSTGASIHPHIDWGPFIHASCTFNLNDNYNGGEFAFFNGQHTITLGKGDALIFPADSFWVHEVKPVTEGIRYSTNSFITSLPDDIQRNLLNSLNTIQVNDSELDLQK